MTKREFYNNIINNTINDDVITMAKELLEKMDAELTRSASSSNAKRDAENAPIIAEIEKFFENSNTMHTASEVSAALGISVQKASSLLRKMVSIGTLIAEEINVPKKGKQKGYKLAITIVNVTVEDDLAQKLYEKSAFYADFSFL